MALSLSAGAQTTTGNAANGDTLFNTTFNCSGCHLIDAPVLLNAMDAGGQIAYANSRGMGGANGTAQNFADIAAYISQMNLTGVIPPNILQNSAGLSFTLPFLTLNTIYGGYTGVSLVTPPAKGTVSFSGKQAIYVPAPGALGSDSFTYVANRPGGTSSVRTQFVNIVANAPVIPTLHTFAGGFYGDGAASTSASDFFSDSMAVDGSGNLYLADEKNDRVRKVTASTGIITTVAGNGLYDPYGGDGSLAVNNSISVFAVAVDGAANLYVTGFVGNGVSGRRCIYKVAAATGQMSAVTGTCDFVIDAMVINGAGTLYFVDGGRSAVYSVPASGGVATVFAGQPGYAGFSGDGGQATNALLDSPTDLALDGAGNVYIADTNNSRIRKVTVSSGVITTVAGNGFGFGGDGAAATSALLAGPRGIRLDAGNNLFIADTGNKRIRRVASSNGFISTVVGNGVKDSLGDGGVATAASLSSPTKVVLDAAGNLFIADNAESFSSLGARNRVRKVAAGSNIISTLVGTGAAIGAFNGDGNPWGISGLNGPRGIAVNATAGLYFSDQFNHRIRRVLSDGTLVTIAGNGTASFSGDGASAASASLNSPAGIAMSSSGVFLYIADQLNHRVRRLDTRTGILTTVAGNGIAASGGDGGSALQAGLSQPLGVAVDAIGNLYIADTGNHRIRRVAAATGLISTVAGSGTAGFAGDGGVATAASLNSPASVAVDFTGNLVIADTFNHRVRRVAATTGLITTVAGNGSTSFGGDDGPATAASLAYPMGVAVDTGLDIFIADYDHHRVRRVNASSGKITTFAGNGTYGYNRDWIPAPTASLRNPAGVAVDSKGAVYVADFGNHRARSTTEINFYGSSGAPPVRASVGTVSSSSGLLLVGSSASLIFESPQVVGSTATQRAYPLKNNQSSGAIYISSVDASAEYAATSTCVGFLPAGAQCDITLSFTPAAAGERPGTLTIQSDVPGASTAVYLSSGFGITPPGAPAIQSVAPGNGQAAVHFLPPASDGESPIISYSATCGALSGSGSQSPIVVAGLSNGTTYPCSVRAFNAAGNGAPSSALNVTPGAPTTFTLGVTVTGSGFGAVQSGAGLVNCPGTCSTSLAAGSSLTLSAYPSAGSTLASWSGCDSTNGLTCSVVSLSAARSIVATFNLVPLTAPSAPTLTAAMPGNAQAVLLFSPPASDGGAAITNYQATCNPGGIQSTGLGSPLKVTGLSNNVAYICSLKAENSQGTGPASGTLSVTPSALAPPAMVAAKSRKVHGSLGAFDLPIDITQPITGAITVEPRIAVAGHTALFQFSDPVSSVGSISAVDGAMNSLGALQAGIDGNNVLVSLPSLVDGRRITISLSGLNGLGGSVGASLGFLVGDVNSSRLVTAADLAAIKARSGQATNDSNFRFDLNAGGLINSVDLSAAKARVGVALP